MLGLVLAFVLVVCACVGFVGVVVWAAVTFVPWWAGLAGTVAVFWWLLHDTNEAPGAVRGDR